MRKFVIAVLLAAPVLRAQQLPAGSRDAKDNSRSEAANAAVRAAEDALERGDFSDAQIKLKLLATQRPTDAQVLYDLGYADERIGDGEAARRDYAAAIAAHESAAEPRVALGLLEARAGKMDAARPQFAAVAAMSDAPAAMRGRALRALAQIDQTASPAQASEELLQAIKLTGATPDDTALSASLAARLGDATDAEASYRKLLASDATNVDAALGLARLLQAKSSDAEAVAALESARAAHPDDLRLISAEAAALGGQGKFDEAIVMLAPAARSLQGAGKAAVERQLARLYLAAEQPAEAETLFRQVLASTPEDAPSLDDLGTALVREHKYAEAQEVLTRAVSLREKFPTQADFGESAGHLAFAASKNNDPRACLQALALRASVLPNSPPSLFLQATAYDSLHQYKSAILAYRAFLAAAGDGYANEEFEARHRIVALEHTK